MAGRPGKSFFDQLREGITRVEENVKALKQSSEHGFRIEDPEEQLKLLMEDKKIVQNLEKHIHSTYGLVMELRSIMYNESFDLDRIEHKLQDLSSHLNDFVKKHDLTKFGYKPWINPRSYVKIPAVEVVPEEVDLPKQNGIAVDINANIQSEVDGCVASKDLPTASQKTILKTPEVKSNGIKKKTPKSVGFKTTNEPEQAIVVEENIKPSQVTAPVPTPRPRVKSPVKVKEPEPEAKPAVIPAKRYTILPPFLLSSHVREKPVFQHPAPPAFSMMPSTYVPTSTWNPVETEKVPIPEETFAVEHPVATGTSSFMTSMNEDTSSLSFMGFNNNVYKSFNHTTTPVREVESTLNEQVTVEFTPGLTTKRQQKAAKRCKEKEKDGPLPPVSESVDQITRSLKEVSLCPPDTPVQPIPTVGLIQSIKAVKSHSKNFGSTAVPGTPQMPDSSEFDQQLHKYMLRSRTKQNYTIGK